MQLSRCSGRQAGAFKPASSSRRGPAAAARPAQQQRRTAAVVRAALAPEAAAAVAQQGIAFAIVLAAEGAFSLSSVPEGDKGRPQIPLLAAGVGGTAAVRFSCARSSWICALPAPHPPLSIRIC